MINIQFDITIKAPKVKVWDTLWQDKTFREWAGLIDPGTYMVGELIEGQEVQYISAENGYGVTSFVEKLIENEYVLFKHSADTQDSGENLREEEWTGGSESYSLSEHDGITTLQVVFDVPEEMKEYFEEHYPKALEKVKELAE